MNSSSPSPVHLAVDHPEAGNLTIFWDDGVECLYALADLRKVCPCATCRDLRREMDEGDNLLLMTNPAIDPSTEIAGIDTVGRYAIQFTWTDGHNTGIYTYEFLREECRQG